MDSSRHATPSSPSPTSTTDRARIAVGTLKYSGFDSVASLVDALLQDDALDYADCRRMALAILQHKNSQTDLANDQEFRQQLYKYTSRIASEEMDTLVKDKALRLPVAKVNTETLDQFDIKVVAERQKEVAPLTTSLLRVAAGLDSVNDSVFDSDDEEATVELGDQPSQEEKLSSRNRSRGLVATVSLCMLCYARNQQSNILQVVTGYLAYADNLPKRTVETLHRMGLLVTPETVRRALSANAKAIRAEIQEKAWNRRFFISFDNMNFYEHRRDQRLANKGHLVTYTAGYMCVMRSEHDDIIDGNWAERYLNTTSIDHSAVNELVVEDFLLDAEDLKHRAFSAQYMLSNILATHFPKSLKHQTIRRKDGLLVPLYTKLSAPLNKIKCRVVKTELIPLPTLPLDGSSISGTIDIIARYLAILDITDVAVRNKRIMFKGDFLTVRNITTAIYQRRYDVGAINQFQFIEPIAGFLHLQMNVLKLFLGAVWGKKTDRVSLARFQVVLSRKGATKSAKDFHASDDFFRTVVTSFVIVLCMHDTSCHDMPGFKAWLSSNNWPNMIQNVEKEYLDPFKAMELRDRAVQEVEGDVTTAIGLRKDTWLTDRESARAAGDTTAFKQQPKWDVDWQKEMKKATLVKRDIIRENALIILSLGLLYLDFVDACRGGYSGRVEQCIRCFAVVFQGSDSKNYAGETLHMVACLKKVWNADFKRAWHEYCVINPSGREDEFYPDDRFGETIIKLNKEKIGPSSNAKTDDHLREVISLNVLALWKSKEIMARATGATRRGNHHSVVKSDQDISSVVNLLVAEAPFQEELGRGSGENAENELTDLFSQGTAALASSTPLSNYLRRARGNWGRRAQPRGDERQEEEQHEEEDLFDDDIGDLVERDAAIDDDEED